MTDNQKILTAVAIMILIMAALIMTGCRSTSEVTTESHSYSRLVTDIDSLMRVTKLWQQDIYQKQSSLVDSIRQSEKRDSSHVVVVNEKGDTVKERVEIHHYLEREHSSEKSESEMWIQKFREVDSLLHVSLDRQAVADSLLREHEKEIVKQNSLSWWQKAKQSLGEIMLLLLIVAAGYIIYNRSRLHKT